MCKVILTHTIADNETSSNAEQLNDVRVRLKHFYGNYYTRDTLKDIQIFY